MCAYGNSMQPWDGCEVDVSECLAGKRRRANDMALKRGHDPSITSVTFLPVVFHQSAEQIAQRASPSLYRPVRKARPEGP